jgi:hypothetical protein
MISSVLAHCSDILARAGHSSTSRPLRRCSIPTWPRIDFGQASSIPSRRWLPGYLAIQEACAG